MDRRRAIITLGACGLAPAALATAPARAEPDPPALAIKEAIEVAEKYVKDRGIEAEGEHPHWKVTWKANGKVKGGWFAIRVRPDKGAEVFFGE